MAHAARPLIRPARHPAIVVLAALAAVAGQGGCGDDEPPRPAERDYGSVTLEFHVAESFGVVAFTLTGPNGLSRTAEVVPSQGIATTTLDDLAVGDGYQVTAAAMAADGSRCERTWPPFSVAPNQTRRVSLSLTCQHTGGPSGDGGLNLCPLVDAIVASADRAYVGSPLDITGSGSDSDGPAPLSFLWTTPSGTLGDSTAPEMTFTCTTAGPVTLTLTVSDGDTSAGCPATSSITVTCVPALERIGHIVVIYMENHSFDNLFGGFPGVDGLSSPTADVPQIDDATGLPYATLPQVDPNVPLGLPNRPFDLSQYVPVNRKTIDLVHRFYQQQQQINGGKMDRFATVSDAKGLVLGFYPTAMLPVAQLALANPTQSTVCDHFFHAAFGGSFLNHHWLIAAATPVFPNAPAALVAALDADGKLVSDGAVTSDGFVVNGLDPSANPRGAASSPDTLVPPQLAPTIGDRLSAAGVDWAWYAGGWDDALAGTPDATFNPGHQPFVYYASYADGTAARAAHLRDDNKLAADIASGTLPPVAFVKPVGFEDEHPGIADLLTGQRYAVDLINSLMKSSFWDDTVVILTYDENGGFWDHVPPPVVDRWGPGTRVPTVIFSPFAKGGVDSTVYDTTAILKLIETRWNVASLGTRDAAQADLAVHALRLSP